MTSTAQLDPQAGFCKLVSQNKVVLKGEELKCTVSDRGQKRYCIKAHDKKISCFWNCKLSKTVSVGPQNKNMNMKLCII